MIYFKLLITFHLSLITNYINKIDFGIHCTVIKKDSTQLFQIHQAILLINQ